MINGNKAAFYLFFSFYRQWLSESNSRAEVRSVGCVIPRIFTSLLFFILKSLKCKFSASSIFWPMHIKASFFLGLKQRMSHKTSYLLGLPVIYSSLIWEVPLYKSLCTHLSVHITTKNLILSGRSPLSPFQSPLPKTSFFSPTTQLDMLH